jgi:hypothetical protein
MTASACGARRHVLVVLYSDAIVASGVTAECQSEAAQPPKRPEARGRQPARVPTASDAKPYSNEKSASSFVRSNSVRRSAFRFARRSSAPRSRIFLDSEMSTPSPELSM